MEQALKLVGNAWLLVFVFLQLGYWFFLSSALVIGARNQSGDDGKDALELFFLGIFFQSAPRAAGGLSLTSAVTFDLSSQP